MTRSSKTLSRTQLLGMVASLRGGLFDLLNSNKQGFLVLARQEEDAALREEDLRDIEKTLKATEFELDPEDETDGGFDKSWLDEYFHSFKS